MGKIILDAVGVAYRSEIILSDISVVFKAHQHWAIYGPNGVGKSTLLQVIYGLIQPTSGQVRWEGIRKSQIAYLAQNPGLLAQTMLNVFELVSFGLWYKTAFYRAIDAKLSSRIWKALADVGLHRLARQPVDTLSRGQLQRALLARLLVQDADYILLDEPFNAVDESTLLKLFSLFERLVKEGKTIIAVVHDKQIINSYFSQTIHLEKIDDYHMRATIR